MVARRASRDSGGNGGNGSRWIRPEKRLAIYRRDGLACVYCRHTRRRLTLDHLKPRSKGGTNDATNLVTACFRCNSQRNQTPGKWAAELGLGPKSWQLIINRAKQPLDIELAKELLSCGFRLSMLHEPLPDPDKPESYVDDPPSGGPP